MNSEFKMIENTGGNYFRNERHYVIRKFGRSWVAYLPSADGRLTGALINYATSRKAAEKLCA